MSLLGKMKLIAAIVVFFAITIPNFLAAQEQSKKPVSPYRSITYLILVS